MNADVKKLPYAPHFFSEFFSWLFLFFVAKSWTTLYLFRLAIASRKQIWLDLFLQEFLEAQAEEGL